jgi:pyruvate dehydrogenase E1 component beta subunit
MTYRDAVRSALRDILRSEPRAFLMGEDVGRYGGSFACSKGLLDEFGPVRVRDTPLAESTFLGAGIGAAIAGLRPIVEIMTVNFSLLALDQVVNNAATLRHMSGGQISVPLVVRMATGGGRQLAAQHSHSLEGWYAHVPGLRVAVPASPADARGMLLAAIRDPDPTFLFEPSVLYPVEDEVDLDAGPADLRHAAVRRPGRDLTLVAFGAAVPKALAAADTLAGDGIAAEVVDVRVLRPLDLATILGSAGRTRRLLVVDEAWRTGGFAAEIAASVAERAFYELDAPVGRVAGAEVPMPYPKHLEEAALPQPATIAAAARALLGRHG